MASNMRDLVKQGYDEGSYAEVYGRESQVLEPFEKALCNELIACLSSSSHILDLGCGVGLPYDEYFVEKGFSLTGIDISEKHIHQARKNLPAATFIQGDFFTEEVVGHFDAIISFYAIFHIPRTEHKLLLQHIHSLLKKDAFMLITLGADDMECDVNDDFVGKPMAWSSFSVEENKQLVKEAGFEIKLLVEDYRKERHLWVLAQKL